jgi:hypothetical protein
MTTITPDTIVRIPDHVAHRPFDADTVALNLRTGHYHGLNRTAGRMFELLREHGRVGTAAEIAAGDYGRPLEETLADMVQLCDELAQRGLIELGPDTTPPAP